MNKVLLRSVMRGLANGQNFNCYISREVAVRLLERSEFLRRCNDGVLGALQCEIMMMSTRSTSEAEKEQKKKSSNGNDNVVVSSYWGIQRPKIENEDGIEWPWNCFKDIHFQGKELREAQAPLG